MSENVITAPAATAAGYIGPIGRAVLAVGPAATVAGLLHFQSHPYLAVMPITTLLVVALAFWSPMPLSIPALMLGDARDWALPGYRGLFGRMARGVVLLPYLLTAPNSPVRTEVALSLAGFAAGLLLAAPTLF